MSFDEILGVLAQFNLYAWLIAAIVSAFLWRYTGTGGWGIFTVGSLFVVLRQVWKFFPDYKTDQAADFILNTYMMRFFWGAIGATILSIALIMLIVNYHVTKSGIEDE